MSKKTIDIKPSEFAQRFLYLNGKPFSLADYKHLIDIYDSTSKEIVLKFSRQTAKSTTLAMIMTTKAAMIPNFKELYVSPTVDQTKIFSHERVTPVIEGSPLIRDNYINSTLIQNVYMKQFLNGSRMYLRYALLNADRLRGYSADMNLFDETQDLKPDIIPVVKETMSRSLYKIALYAGTPKRTRGTLADLWFNSTMNEYAIKCDGCGKWNILDEKNIGKEGPICSKCGKYLELSELKAEWVSTYSLVQKPILEGYRVCILHFAKAPWVNWHNDVILKRENSSKALFYNESLALEYDEGVAPINKFHIQACCSDRPLNTTPTELDKSYSSIMGIDYGPTNSENSNTVCVVVQKRLDKVYVVYMKKFLGKEAEYSYIHKKVPELMRTWNCTHLAADYGMGEAANSEIRSRIGFDKVIAFQHMRTQKEKVRWNPKMPAYTLNRTATMTDLFNAIKNKKIDFPRWDFTEPFAEDILNIYMESDEDTGVTKYGNSGPDDFFHALLYAVLSLEMIYGEKIIS